MHVTIRALFNGMDETERAILRLRKEEIPLWNIRQTPVTTADPMEGGAFMGALSSEMLSLLSPEGLLYVRRPYPTYRDDRTAFARTRDELPHGWTEGTVAMTFETERIHADAAQSLLYSCAGRSVEVLE